MAFNPMQLMKLKERYTLFQTQHPKIMPFLKTAKERIDPGTMIELKITTSDGKTMNAGLKLTADDIRTLEMLTK